MNRKVSGIALLLILLLGASLSAQTTWTGNNSSNWNLASNWTNGLPGPFNEPTIPATPSGPHFPIVTVFTYFNFNVQNFGTITIQGDGGVSQFGIFVNYAGATLVLIDTASNMKIEPSGSLENFGNILNGGTFSNEGGFSNSTTGTFTNNHVFSHSDGTFDNRGSFNNFGQFFSEADFQNIGTFNNHLLFNNNDEASNSGVMHCIVGSTLRNDHTFTNQQNGSMNISGALLNNRIFVNKGQFTGNFTSETINSQLIKNTIGANWSNQGKVTNVLCAIYENKGTLLNTSIFENEGFIYADSPIAPNAPSNLGSAVVVTPNNTGSLCHNATVGLDANNAATVEGIDHANDQFVFCTGWTILVNGLPSFSFIGCANVGQHNVNVSFIDPFGRTTVCPAIVTVVDDLAPIIACAPTQTLPLPAGQCTAPANLNQPNVLVENCAVASITNNAPALLPIGQTAVIWTVADQNGNAGYCTQTVVVEDQSPPTINCPPAKTLNTTANQCGVLAQSSAIAGDPAFAFDNCGTPVVSNNAPALLPLGNTTITWTATDAFGNFANCTQQITVVDAQPPVIVNCPSDITVQAQLAGCQAVATWGGAIATDNCSVPTQVFSISSGSVFDLGTTSVTVLVSDASLNAATCQFEVTVVDNQPPSWSNCPGNSTITLLDCGDVAVGSWTPPTASDPCLVGTSSNFQVGDVLPIGQNLIEYKATDQAGNTSSCSFTITVDALLALDCPTDIVVSVPPGTTSSPVSWNSPPGTTNCTVCASVDIPGFYFMAEKSGNRYYTYLGGPVTVQEATTIASQHGGYLAAIGEANENELLRKEFSPLFQTAWIGASDAALEGQFHWQNGEPVNFSNWQNGAVPANDQHDFTVLRNDGFWVDEAGDATHAFIMEVPCYQFDVSSNNMNALNGLVFPLGSTTISYEISDNCGNTCFCDFQVKVFQNQTITPCIAAGNSDFGWIESVQTEGFSNPSGNDGGRGDYANTVFDLPDPGCILKLTPGGNASDKYMYWRIWADLNMDGDFFDDNEVLGTLEGVGEQDFCYDVLANLPTGPVGLRIAMSRWDYAAACGNYIAGEAEDYTVNFMDSTQFHHANCHWTFGVLDAEVVDLKVNLTWLGDANCDVANFLVERSADGFQYELIGEVPPLVNGQLPNLYEFIDRTPIYGHNFYRIKVVMADSSVVISDKVEMDFNIDKDAIFIYPNPAATDAVLHIYPLNGHNARIFIANHLGQTVYDRQHIPLEDKPLILDLHGFAQGVYTIYVRAEGEREQVRRLVVVQP